MKLTFDQIRLIAETAEQKVNSLKSDVEYNETAYNEEVNKALKNKADELGCDVSELDDETEDEVVRNARNASWRYDNMISNKKELARWEEILKTINTTTY